MTAPPLVRELKGLLPALLVAEALETFMVMLRAAGADAASDADVDALVDALRAADRAALGQVYDAMRETDVFRRIVTAQPLRDAAQAMTGAVRLHSPFQHAVFPMDLAGEPWRGFDWHQDYPYNMLCHRSVSRKPELQPGDVLMFHNAVPHRSGYNPGPRHRYSIQVRFGDLLAPEVIARGWANRRADGFEAFAALHPDLIASEEHP